MRNKENKKIGINIKKSENFSSSSDAIFLSGDANLSLESIPKNHIKLIITSPPYNIGKEYEDKKSLEEYLGSIFPIIEKLKKVLKKDGSICWQVGNHVSDGEIFPLDIFYYQIFKDLGFKLRNRIIWHFNHGLHGTKRLSGRYETMLWFTKSDSYTFNLAQILGIEFITSELQKTTELPPNANCSGETELLKFPKPNLEYGELVDN